MSSLFGQLGQLAQMMKNLPKMQEEMEKLKAKIALVVEEGDAGAGMVKVKVNGLMEVLRCEISDELLKMNDKEMLEDLVRAAVNQAMKKARQTVTEATTSSMSGLGMPNIPGLQ